MCRILLLLLLITLSIDGFAHTDPPPVPRMYMAQRITDALTIDGQLNEPIWQQASATGDFIQREPKPGQSASQPTEVRMLYDDKAIYIGARMYEQSTDSILAQLSARDEIGITDWFGVLIDAYQDGINGLGFIVTSAGVQFDTKYTPNDNGGDQVTGGQSTWDAVWISETHRDAEGWSVEIKIPYSAIRFPNKPVQEWNINFARMIRRSREVSYWNEVRPDLDGLLRQSGRLEGIQDIEPPTRLSATPYITTYLINDYDPNTSPSYDWSSALNGGMDVKYGINDAFTLDMTLIPDFGQVRSDNEVLNLSPFEVRFDENRQFFTEGTELFNKAGIFYSRRVGGRPLNYGKVEDQLQESEEIISNPLTSKLYNATKVSGRTAAGLGLGLFNATAQPTYARVRDTENGAEREIQTAALTNYNILVADQNLKNNSFVSLINTNVWRSGEDYEANVTATQFRFNDASNTYSLAGRGVVNQLFYSKAETASGQDSLGIGHMLDFDFDKVSGNFQYGAGYREESADYDINDLGFLRAPNSRNFSLRGSYNIFEPFGQFNRFRANIFTRYGRLYAPDVFTDFGIFLRTFAVTKNFVGMGGGISWEPIQTYDYFEPRTADYSRYYAYPRNFGADAFISTDYRKMFAIDLDVEFRTFNEPGRIETAWSIEPRFRPNDKFFFILESEFNFLRNDIGYVGKDETSVGYESMSEQDILFGRRNRRIFVNTLSANYAFNNKMSLSLRTRHYWSRVIYNRFFRLGEQGELAATDYQGFDANQLNLHDINTNIFSVDLIYLWRFAPGSDLSIVWKNNISQFGDEVDLSYGDNLGNLLELAQRNSLSLRVIYFLDYLYLKK